jgi:hypothetical protein
LDFSSFDIKNLLDYLFADIIILIKYSVKGTSSKFLGGARNMKTEAKDGTEEESWRTDLESFLGLANADLTGLDSAGLERVIEHYAQLVVPPDDGPFFLRHGQIYSQLIKGLKGSPGPKEVSKVKSLLSGILTHFRSRIQAVMNARSWKGSDFVIELEQMVKLYIDVKRGRFVANFLPQVGGKDKVLDLEDHKTLIDSRLMNIILDGNLKPDRFQVCEHCGKYFYKDSERRIYCSAKCARSSAQSKYIARKKSI